jgi:hypothetical protein
VVLDPAAPSRVYAGAASGVFALQQDIPTSFYTLPPCRLIDTRNPAGPTGGPALAAGQRRALVLAGECGIPASAIALSLNITVAQPTAAGFFQLYPGGSSSPATSTLNFAAGQVRANNAVAPVGSGATLVVVDGQAPGGTAHLIIDVNGYFAPP